MGSNWRADIISGASIPDGPGRNSSSATSPGLPPAAPAQVWLAISLFGGAVTAASFGLIYLPVALGLVVIAYVLARIVPLSELYTHIEWPVVVLLGSMIPLGAALESSGGTELIAGALRNIRSSPFRLLGRHPPGY